MEHQGLSVIPAKCAPGEGALTTRSTAIYSILPGDDVLASTRVVGGPPSLRVRWTLRQQ